MSDLYRRGSDLSTARLAIYVRASEDSEDTETSVNAQRQRGEQWAAREGITDVKVYCDNDLSASLYARKDREDFDRLCADVESGDRNLIWFWTSSRQTRRLDVYVPFRDLCRRKGVAWVIKRRIYDLNDPTDLRALGNDAVNNEVFSLELSENLKLAHEQRASMGRPAGEAPYGYLRVYDHRRRFIGQEPDERPVTLLDETGKPRRDDNGEPLTTTRAAVVREIFARMANREEILTVAKDFDRRGIPTPRDEQGWLTTTIRRIALNHAYIGIMVHNGEIVERPAPCWTPLLQNADGSPDEETFYAARAHLLDPSRRTNRATHSVHLLTNIPECHVCDGPVVGVKLHDYRWSSTGEREVYRCHTNGHATALKAPVDEFVLFIVDGYLAREDVYTDLLGAVDTSAEHNRLNGEVHRLRTDLEEWRQLAEQGEVSPISFARTEKGLTEKIKALEAELELLRAPALLAGRIGPNRTETLYDLDFQTQRKVIRYCASIRLKPAGKGRAPHVSERLIWRWKIGPDSANAEPIEFPTMPDTYDAVKERAEVEFAAMLSAGRLPGIMEIRRALNIGQRKAKIVQVHLASIAPDARKATSKHDELLRCGIE